eukprot:3769361-Pleurochrysis_carterae.AAC.1
MSTHLSIFALTKQSLCYRDGKTCFVNLSKRSMLYGYRAPPARPPPWLLTHNANVPCTHAAVQMLLKAFLLFIVGSEVLGRKPFLERFAMHKHSVERRLHAAGPHAISSSPATACDSHPMYEVGNRRALAVERDRIESLQSQVVSRGPPRPANISSAYIGVIVCATPNLLESPMLAANVQRVREYTARHGYLAIIELRNTSDIWKAALTSIIAEQGEPTPTVVAKEVSEKLQKLPHPRWNSYASMFESFFKHPDLQYARYKSLDYSHLTCPCHDPYTFSRV